MSTDEDARKPLVLIVDDDPQWQVTTAELLKGLAVRTETAPNVKAALDFIDAHGVKSNDCLDLVVLDFRLPLDADQGVDVLGGLKTLLATRLLPADVPVVVFTAYPDYDSCAECMKAGAHSYLPKYSENGERNTRKLIQVCRSILRGHLRSQYLPPQEWFAANASELRRQFGDRHVVLIHKAAVKEAKTTWFRQCPRIAGYAVVARNTYEKLADFVAATDDLRVLLPPIIYVPAFRVGDVRAKQ